MPTKFANLMKEIEDEAAAGGEDAVAELAALRTRYQLARELMETRRARHLTQEQLAELSGVGQGEISKIESASANPTIATFTALTGALGAELHVVGPGSQDPRAVAP